ncbi:MAG: SDR family oxidoreductase [Dehalococcoidia bacterium]|nr:SDR family oxidoreductase [Dehalococcoidia bacterium]
MGSLFSLEGKTAIVTGASRWTGKVIALEMAKAGVDLVLCARTPEPLEAAAAEVRSLGRRCIAVPTDVGDAEQVVNLVRKAKKEFGRIDILVNNAGTDLGTGVPTLELTEDVWDANVRLNLKGPFLCSKAVAPIMIEQGGGNIVDIASTAGLRVSPDSAAYGAAKAGLMHLVMKLAVEWAKYNIRVNAVAPGFIAIPIFPGYLDHMPDLKAIYERIPLAGGVKMEEIAAAVIYLASDAAGSTTGVTITLDRGMVTKL